MVFKLGGEVELSSQTELKDLEVLFNLVNILSQTEIKTHPLFKYFFITLMA